MFSHFSAEQQGRGAANTAVSTRKLLCAVCMPFRWSMTITADSSYEITGCWFFSLCSDVRCSGSAPRIYKYFPCTNLVQNEWQAKNQLAIQQNRRRTFYKVQHGPDKTECLHVSGSNIMLFFYLNCRRMLLNVISLPFFSLSPSSAELSPPGLASILFDLEQTYETRVLLGYLILILITQAKNFELLQSLPSSLFPMRILNSSGPLGYFIIYKCKWLSKILTSHFLCQIYIDIFR